MRIAILLLLNLVLPWFWGWIVYAVLTRAWPMTETKRASTDARRAIPHDYQI